MESQVGFEAAMQQLATSVGALEVGEMGLDGALRQYEQSVHLLRYCYGLLDGAERAVALLKGVTTSGQAETEAFDGSTSRDVAPPARDDLGEVAPDVEDDEIPY